MDKSEQICAFLERYVQDLENGNYVAFPRELVEELAPAREDSWVVNAARECLITALKQYLRDE